MTLNAQERKQERINNIKHKVSSRFHAMATILLCRVQHDAQAHVITAMKHKIWGIALANHMNVASVERMLNISKAEQYLNNIQFFIPDVGFYDEWTNPIVMDKVAAWAGVEPADYSLADLGLLIGTAKHQLELALNYYTGPDSASLLCFHYPQLRRLFRNDEVIITNFRRRPRRALSKGPLPTLDALNTVLVQAAAMGID